MPTSQIIINVPLYDNLIIEEIKTDAHAQFIKDNESENNTDNNQNIIRISFILITIFLFFIIKTYSNSFIKIITNHFTEIFSKIEFNYTMTYELALFIVICCGIAVIAIFLYIGLRKKRIYICNDENLIILNEKQEIQIRNEDIKKIFVHTYNVKNAEVVLFIKTQNNIYGIATEYEIYDFAKLKAFFCLNFPNKVDSSLFDKNVNALINNQEIKFIDRIPSWARMLILGVCIIFSLLIVVLIVAITTFLLQLLVFKNY